MSSQIKIFDGHNDSMGKLSRAGVKGFSKFLYGESGWDVDMPGMKQVNFVGGFFALFTPTALEDRWDNNDNFTVTEHGYEIRMAPPLAYSHAEQYIKANMNLMREAEKQSKKAFSIVKKMTELERCLTEGNVAAVMHFEGAEAIAEDLSNLQEYYDDGLRSVGLVWSRPNVFGIGVPFQFPRSPDTGPGLTSAGKKLVQACNKMGIVVDLAHLNEKGFWEVAALSTKPLVVTHTGVYAICPSTRNLTDKQIDAVGEAGGIVGIYFDVPGLRRDGDRSSDTPLALIVEHIQYVIKRIGIDHVGFGSDFDGAVMPNELSSVAGMPKLIDELAKAGLSKDEIQKIAYGNWHRIFEETWRN